MVGWILEIPLISTILSKDSIACMNADSNTRPNGMGYEYILSTFFGKTLDHFAYHAYYNLNLNWAIEGGYIARLTSSR